MLMTYNINMHLHVSSTHAVKKQEALMDQKRLKQEWRSVGVVLQQSFLLNT